MLTKDTATEYHKKWITSYKPEIRDIANRLLYYEAMEMYEKCMVLRDSFTVEAYSWCQSLLTIEVINLEDQIILMEMFEESFDKELMEIRDKYFP